MQRHTEIHSVVLVEGISDRVALETLAVRQGRDLAREGVAVVPIGGAQAIGRALADYEGLRVAGLCDAGEARDFARALERAGVEAGFYVCEADLEDELIRALGAGVVLGLVESEGQLGSFRTYQKQPAHRGKPVDQQLRGFLTNWKIRYAPLLVGALDLAQVPRPLDRVLAQV
jgi:hypothetical protein